MQTAKIAITTMHPVVLPEGKILLYVMGKVQDHPKFYDGEYIRTSRITSFDLEKGTFQTLNTIYTII